MDSQSCKLEKKERIAQTKRKKNVGRNQQDDVYITTKNIKMFSKEKYEQVKFKKIWEAREALKAMRGALPNWGLTKGS